MYEYFNHTRTLEDKVSQREIIQLLREQNALLRQLLQLQQGQLSPNKENIRLVLPQSH
ncbi:MAG: hypothetical protein HN591_04600 [Flavobacteriales bacterium]|jgi:hypothetical protein|nr:hypothetical protein [Flavobacteriales bacterium]